MWPKVTGQLPSQEPRALDAQLLNSWLQRMKKLSGSSSGRKGVGTPALINLQSRITDGKVPEISIAGSKLSEVRYRASLVVHFHGFLKDSPGTTVEHGSIPWLYCLLDTNYTSVCWDQGAGLRYSCVLYKTQSPTSTPTSPK